MHYIVDGYNLLFRRHSTDTKRLQSQREELLADLRSAVDVLRIAVTVVFDSTAQEDLQRSHLGPMEVVYTTQGLTADEYILQEVMRLPHRKRIAVVTSDKRLASQCRHCGAQTLSGEDFIDGLRRQLNNKRRHPQKKTVKPPAPKVPRQPDVAPSVQQSPPHYEELFQKRYDALVKEEEAERDSKRALRKRRKKRNKTSQ